MTDYKEEQTQELEALESIYPDELKVIATSPYGAFELHIVSQKEEYGDEDSEEASVTIKFSYTEKYPDEVPIMEITDSENLEDDQLNELLDMLHSQANENLGMAMVFTLVSAIQEELTTLMEQSKQRKVEAEEKKKRAEEELERKKFEGTRVTIENFLAWKTKFDAEMAELNKNRNDNEIARSKLTGKELFLQDASMMESDIQLLQEGESVEVDESLFQDMDDLDIGDDELAGVDD
ncbi:RWD domain-containing protein 1-like [Ruditapes philippinarum]|uniref:RWD domain-containing protein 1-like n=1 Tax=Ruditapes philippinarum TaxID=129788 RepID=UPI00295AC742|nr:RWD domain-containing protein 1-like [Ruditapes philippinarum]